MAELVEAVKQWLEQHRTDPVLFGIAMTVWWFSGAAFGFINGVWFRRLIERERE